MHAVRPRTDACKRWWLRTTFLQKVYLFQSSSGCRDSFHCSTNQNQFKTLWIDTERRQLTPRFLQVSRLGSPCALKHSSVRQAARMREHSINMNVLTHLLCQTRNVHTCIDILYILKRYALSRTWMIAWFQLVLTLFNDAVNYIVLDKVGR